MATSSVSGKPKTAGDLRFRRSPNDLLVGMGRFELPTPCSQSRCATWLRHIPDRQPVYEWVAVALGVDQDCPKVTTPDWCAILLIGRRHDHGGPEQHE